ncbi:hypothetical protein KSS87_018258 [Heliosperma pusillum]|nr:hypothetical protein KSS87_018258 [Heliosperma pusillum]
MVYTDSFTPTTTTLTSSSSEPDDISAFLRHLVHRSSAPSTSSPSPSPFHPTLPSHTIIGSHACDNNNNNNNNNINNSSTPLTCSLSSPPFPPTANFSGSDRITSSPTGGYFPVSGGSHLSSNIDYTDYCDYESEEGAEGAATDEQRSLSRHQSKRTRAAEVHNLSEKTDKASMLDEAIEYLKQLQLQVQLKLLANHYTVFHAPAVEMLSMRNGMSLNPMCLPEDQGITNATQLSQIGMHNLNSRSASFDHISITNALNIIPDTSHSTFNLVNQCSSSTIPTLSSLSNVSKSKMTDTLEQDSCVHSNFQRFQSQNLGHGKSLPATLPHSFGAENSNMERHNTLESQSQTYYGSGSQGIVLENMMEHKSQQTDSSIFSGLHTASSSAQGDKLTIGR